jgi:2-keto-4-pentenoate hydratase/2-oxohepta-3-ene-1,7-dioic acid hydratase in catechol pathway
MKFATISTLRHTSQPALVDRERVYPLHFPDMYAVMEAGAAVAAGTAAQESFAIDEVKFLSPLKPYTLRDGYAFEQHVLTANRNRGRDVPAEWYEFPVFYFTNPNAVFGHDDVIPYPPYTDAMDYELEVAVVIGKGGMNIKAEDAEQHIFGYTIFNDWSARDVQRKEMAVGLGPAKGKDFASAFGPVIVTREALADKATGRPGVFDLAMSARVNGVELSRGNFKDMKWSFGEIIARASDSAMLYPGDVIGSGTVGTGCGRTRDRTYRRVEECGWLSSCRSRLRRDMRANRHAESVTYAT